MDGTVLIADDDKNLRNILTQALTRAGAKVRATATLSTLWRWLEEGEGDVVLTDVNLADGDALEMLPRMKAKRPDLQFVVMSAQNTVVTALRSGEAGAFDYLAKPFDLREMLQLLRKAQGQTTNTPIVEKLDQDLPLIGRSEEMQEIYRQLTRIIPSDLPVLISGKAGTGKSLAAEVIHQFGPRKDKPLIRFHGHETSFNAITSAFERAGEGTLVFENIDEFFTNEQRQIQSLMDNGQTKCRVIATTRHNLTAAVNAGNFREDLFFRLNVLGIELPDLSERIEDIGELARHFISHDFSGSHKTLDESAIRALEKRNWPGNVSELSMTIKRAIVMSTGSVISAAELTLSSDQQGQDNQNGVLGAETFSETVEAYVRRFLKLHGENLPPEGLYQALINEVERPLIKVALEANAGNQIQTAQMLDINRNTLRKKIANLDISVTRSKKLM